MYGMCTPNYKEPEGGNETRRRGVERGLGRLQECSEAAVLKYLDEVGGVVCSLSPGAGWAESEIHTYVLAVVGFRFVRFIQVRLQEWDALSRFGNLSPRPCIDRAMKLPYIGRILPLGYSRVFELLFSPLYGFVQSCIYQREKYKRSQHQGGRSFVICE
jgi:hypothetical protein